MGHVRMMAAVQPFISGAISKTINMPEECTVEEIMDAYSESWRLGLKAVAIYRDGSKRAQPLSSGTGKGEKKIVGDYKCAHDGGESGVSPDPAQTTKRAAVGDSQILHRRPRRLHHGRLYEDGTPGEVFISMAKEGSTISGLMDSFATSISYALQYGVRLKFSSTSSATCVLSRAAGPAIRRFPTRNPSWIIFSAGWESSSWARNTQ